MNFVSVSCVKVRKQINDKENNSEGINYENSLSAKIKDSRKKMNFRNLNVEGNILFINNSQAVLKNISRTFGDFTNFNARNESNEIRRKLNQILPGESKTHVEKFATPFSYKIYRNITEKKYSGPNNNIILVAVKNDSSKRNNYKSEKYQLIPKHQSLNFTEQNSTIGKQMLSEINQSTETKIDQNLLDESRKSSKNRSTVFSSKRFSNITEKIGSGEKYGVILVIVNEDSSKTKNNKSDNFELMSKYRTRDFIKTRNTAFEKQTPYRVQENITKNLTETSSDKSKRSSEIQTTASSYVVYKRNVIERTGLNQNYRARSVTKDSSKKNNYKLYSNSELIPTYRSGKSTIISNKRHIQRAVNQSITKNVVNKENSFSYSNQFVENNTTAFACKLCRNIIEKTGSDRNHSAILVTTKGYSSKMRIYKSDSPELLPIYIRKFPRNKESSINSRSVITVLPFLNFPKQNSTTEGQLMSKVKQSTTEKLVNIEFIVDDSPLFIQHSLNIEAILKIVKREHNIQAKILKELALFLPVLLCDILLLWGCWILLRDTLQTIEQPQPVSENADDHTFPTALDTDYTRSSEISFDVKSQEVSHLTRQESEKVKKI